MLLRLTNYPIISKARVQLYTIGFQATASNTMPYGATRHSYVTSPTLPRPSEARPERRPSSAAAVTPNYLPSSERAVLSAPLPRATGTLSDAISTGLSDVPLAVTTTPLPAVGTSSNTWGTGLLGLPHGLERSWTPSNIQMWNTPMDFPSEGPLSESPFATTAPLTAGHEFLDA